MKGTVVALSAPREDSGLYWGYRVRLADSLAAVFAGSPYPGRYDLTVGTSDKGDNVDNFSCGQFRLDSV